MSMHKTHAHIKELQEALQHHKLPHSTPSQLADCFRNGWLYAHATTVPNWREYVEQRLLDWKQWRMNESGDRLSLEDYLSKDTLDELIDYVCDVRSGPGARA